NFRRQLTRRGESGINRSLPKFEGRRIPKVKDYDQEVIVKLYKHEKYSLRQLGKLYNVDHKTIKKIITKKIQTCPKIPH
ncbi:MAG: hypothetical protein AAF487_15105, partial [Bacteroidota bacterium]